MERGFGGPYNLAVRARRKLRGAQTMFGGLLTTVHRDVAGTPLDETLHSSAYSAGLDFRHVWSNRKWAVAGQFTSSRVAGSLSALIRTQRRSSRFLKARPSPEWVPAEVKKQGIQRSGPPPSTRGCHRRS